MGVELTEMKICPSLLSCAYVYEQSPEKQAIRINDVNFQDEGYDDISTPRSTPGKLDGKFETSSFTENLPTSEEWSDENALNAEKLLSKTNENQQNIINNTNSISRLKRENTSLKRQLNTHRKMLYELHHASKRLKLELAHKTVRFTKCLASQIKLSKLKTDSLQNDILLTKNSISTAMSITSKNVLFIQSLENRISSLTDSKLNQSRSLRLTLLYEKSDRSFHFDKVEATSDMLIIELKNLIELKTGILAEDLAICTNESIRFSTNFTKKYIKTDLITLKDLQIQDGFSLIIDITSCSLKNLVFKNSNLPEFPDNLSKVAIACYTKYFLDFYKA